MLLCLLYSLVVDQHERVPHTESAHLHIIISGNNQLHFPFTHITSHTFAKVTESHSYYQKPVTQTLSFMFLLL